MRRLTETIEHTKITRILESDLPEPPEECTVCNAPTLYDADGEFRKCVDCGEVYEAITKPRLALAGRR